MDVCKYIHEQHACIIYTPHIQCKVHIIYIIIHHNYMHTLTLKLSSSSRFIGLMSLCMTCWECTVCVHVCEPSHGQVTAGNILSF